MSKKITRQFIRCESEQKKRVGREKIDQKFIDQTVKKIVRTIEIPTSRIKRRPLIIGMVGLIGSGKRMIARELAKRLRAVVISNSEIRARYFRARKKEYHVYTKPVVEGVLKWVTENGASVVIMDSDCVSQDKRKWLEGVAKGLGAQIKYVRVWADQNVMIERLIKEKVDDPLLIDNVVAVRETWRQTPMHYDWGEKPWPQFKLKKLAIKFLAELDTTKVQEWKEQVSRLVRELKR